MGYLSRRERDIHNDPAHYCRNTTALGKTQIDTTKTPSTWTAPPTFSKPPHGQPLCRIPTSLCHLLPRAQKLLEARQLIAMLVLDLGGGLTKWPSRTPENLHRDLIPKSPKFRGHKMAIFGDLDETFVPKSAIWGVHGAFRSAISSAPLSVAPEVQNFGTGRSIFRGLVLYILALETPNSGICIIHMGSKIWIFRGNDMRARSLYSRVLT